MKFIAILSAFLIAANCFGQDLIEYREGTFTRNGAELSLDQVEQLAKEYQVWGKTRHLFNQGIASNDLAKPESEAKRNARATVPTALGIIGGGLCLWAGNFLGEYYDEPTNTISVGFYALGTLCSSTMFFLANKSAKPQSWIAERDGAFKKVEQRLNEAIQKEGELNHKLTNL